MNDKSSGRTKREGGGAQSEEGNAARVAQRSAQVRITGKSHAVYRGCQRRRAGGPWFRFQPLSRASFRFTKQHYSSIVPAGGGATYDPFDPQERRADAEAANAAGPHENQLHDRRAVGPFP